MSKFEDGFGLEAGDLEKTHQEQCRRKPWEKPKLHTIYANMAENGIMVSSDGVTLS